MASSDFSACPICSSSAERLFEAKGYWVRACSSCRHQFAEVPSAADHVERTYGDSYFFEGGAGYSDYLSEESLLIDRGRRYAKLLTRYTAPGTLLDVGAAAGFIAKGFAGGGWTVSGVEPNPRMSAYAREKLGVNITTGSLENFRSDTKYDLISMIQVIAHFVDPSQVIRKSAELCKPGGYLLIETWNTDSLTRKMFGKNWHEYSPPSVLHWFNPQSLSRLASGAGFTEIGRGRPSKWLNGAHAKSLLKHASEKSAVGKVLSACASIVPDALPIPYPAEDLLWALYRLK